jgi:hypothetical protein
MLLKKSDPPPSAYQFEGKGGPVCEEKPADIADARNSVDTVKTALGERGPVWWGDGAPDYNRPSRQEHPLCRVL